MRPLLSLSCLLLAVPVAAQKPAAVSPERMTAVVRDITEASYSGRAPGGPGEARTVGYLERTLRAIGVEPGAPDGSYQQEVPLLHTVVVGKPTATIAVHGASVTLTQGEGLYLATVRAVDRIKIDAAPMVFVGYGVSAPERGWDDFKGVDLKDKIAVILINDPDFEAKPGEPVAGKFGGRRETYYGRWTYKYEEAVKRGAIGALIVHDTPGAGYAWATVLAAGGESYDKAAGFFGDPRLLMRGWISGEAATDLFKRAGLDLAALRVQARSADFRPVPIGDARFTTDAPVKVDQIMSHNVIAKITGSAHPDETIVYGAHWDAYGVGAPDEKGETVRAGAADDAVGVAGVLELAHLFKDAPKPERTIVFAFWTAEERSLLGSDTYAANPTTPLSKMVANMTVDVLQTAGPARDVVLVGNGQSDLEDRLAVAAKAQGRKVTPEALPERGLYFRADHFSVARRGVPSLLLMAMGGGSDLVNGGRSAGDKWLTDYMKCYHQPCDVWSQKWDLRGAAQDVELFYTIGAGLANSRDWPAWRADSEFKALRDQSAGDRK